MTFCIYTKDLRAAARGAEEARGREAKIGIQLVPPESTALQDGRCSGQVFILEPVRIFFSLTSQAL